MGSKANLPTLKLVCPLSMTPLKSAHQLNFFFYNKAMKFAKHDDPMVPQNASFTIFVDH